MIREHRFNSEWWGGKAGIVADMNFLSLPADEQQQMLRPYDWVELRSELDSAPLSKIAAAGFFQADTQIPFRIGIGRVPDGPSLSTLTVEQASRQPFQIEEGELAAFAHERYRYLPGMTSEKLNRRYAVWSANEIASHPEWCLRISSKGSVQGWFLSEMTDEGLDLQLAMLHRNATISGMYLYQKALVTYASMGARVGHARFSVANRDVLNIYARLGSQFLAPVGVWLWIRHGRRS
jgi:hypothetical protein